MKPKERSMMPARVASRNRRLDGVAAPRRHEDGMVTMLKFGKRRKSTLSQRRCRCRLFLELRRR